VYLLGRLECRDAIPELSRLAREDGNAPVRENALWALDQILPAP
jgi:HEAT repeat protein